MSEQEETAAAAATGAAAAVQAVQDQQRQEEITDNAAAAAAEGAFNAEVARENAEQAAAAAASAGSVAVDAVETASNAEQEAQEARSDVETLRDEFRGFRETVSNGFEEMRGYFRQLTESKPQTADVQHVEVTHHADQASGEQSDPGSGTSSGDAGNTQQPARRHRFGGR
jgi:hypothetical protein